MSNKPLILADNFYDDVVLHPDHIVSTSGTEVVGQELYNIADNLRDLTSHTVSDTNVNIDIKVRCGTAKQVSAIVIDRGHNLKNKTVELHGSNDNFIGSTTIFSATIPGSAGGLPSDANGCLTTEGVWYKTFNAASFPDYRVRVDAMGIGLSPILTGLYLGDSYRFPEYLDGPAAYDYRIKNQVLKNVMSERGVRVKRKILNFAEVDLKIQVEETDYLAFHTQATRLLYNNHPWWFCLDDSVFVGGSDLTRLFQLPGEMVFDPVLDPIHRIAQFLLEEVIPVTTI